MSVHQRSQLYAPKLRQRVRLSGAVLVGGTGLSPSNSHGPWGQYAEAWIVGGAVWIRWAPVAGPPWGHSNVAISSSTADTPRILCDGRGFLVLIWEDGGTISRAESTDDGVSWSTPTTMFASGSHPALAESPWGAVLVAARVAGELQVSYRAPGDTAWSTPAVAVDDASANIALADDGFGLSAGTDGAGRWNLVCTIDGETDISTWFSTDDGASWTRYP